MILMSSVFFRRVYLKLGEDLSEVYRIYELRFFPNVFTLLAYKKTEAEFNIWDRRIIVLSGSFFNMGSKWDHDLGIFLFLSVNSK